MRAFIVRTIFFKELKETLRDRRTLFALLVLPALIHPLLLMFAGSLGSEPHGANHARVAVWGPLAPELKSALDGFELTDRRDTPPADAESAARELLGKDRAQAVLLFSPDGVARLAADDSTTVQVFYDSIRSSSDGTNDRLKKAFDKWNETTIAARLQRRQLPSGFVRPVKLEERNLISKQRDVIAHLGRILPLIMLMVMLTCGMLPAADATAGEKERGTMQTLLCAPVRPIEIIAGKYLAVVVVALLGGAANLMAMAFALGRFAASVVNTEIHFGFGAALGVFAAMVPMALLLAAVLIGIAVFARSYREAQSYLTPVIVVMLVPAMMALRPGAELTAASALIPVTNVTLLTSAVLAGTANAGLYFLVMVANLAYAAAAMVLAARVFEAEQVLLAGEKPWRDVFGRADRVSVTPSPGEAILFGVVTFVAMFYGSLWADPLRIGISFGILVVEAFLLAPPILWTLIARHSFVETFRLKLPSLRGAAAIFILSVSAWTVGVFVYWLETKISPNAAAWSAELARAMGNIDGKALIIIALAPAIAEEACCRGVVMSGLGNSGSKWVAVVGSAIFFGALHINPFHAAIAATLGLVLGFATLETGTILAGALIHACNNGLAALTTRVPALNTLHQDPRVIAAGLILTLFGLWLARGSRRNN